MKGKNRMVAVAAWVLMSPGIAAGQAFAPGTPPDLERRVFVDVNQVTPSRVLDQLCDTIACTLDVDKKLPQPDISLRLSNVRARTALDAVCDMVGCRWSLKGRTLVVIATTAPPAVPKSVAWIQRMKTPLTGTKWKLDGVPLRDVLASLSQELGADVTFEGPDGATPVTEDLRGRSAIDAFERIQSALGYTVTQGRMGMNAATGRQEIRLQGKREPVPREAAAPTRTYLPGEPSLTMPRAISESKPRYTREAMQAKIQGTVTLAAVVEADGTVGEVKVLTSLDPDLDQQAVLAARNWRFEPGTKNGKPVPVQITLEMTFTLK